MASINFLFEFIEHTLESNQDEGLALWSETFDQLFTNWDISSCRLLLRIIKQFESPAGIKNETYLIGMSARGMLELNMGNSKEAIDCYKKALAYLQSFTGGKETESWLWSNLGNIYYLSGSFSDAIESYSHAVEMYQEAGDEKGLALALSNLGNVFRDSGELEKALEYHQRALAWEKEHGEDENMAITLTNLGSILQLKGAWVEAEDAYGQALELFNSSGDLHHQAQVLGDLGTLYLETDQLDKALELFLRDLEANQKAGDILSQSQALNNLAIVYRRQRNSNQALHCYEGSLELKKAIGDQQGELLTLINYCYLLQDIGETKKLRDSLKYAHALALSLENGNQLSRIEALESELFSGKVEKKHSGIISRK